MTLRIEQRLVLVLPMQLDQRRCLIVECRRRHERVVDERPAAPLRVDVTPDDQCLAGLHVGHVKLRLDVCLCLARTDQIGGRAAAHQQPDSLDEHRLAGASFAREDVQARLEFNLDRIDDGEVLNAKEAKHC